MSVGTPTHRSEIWSDVEVRTLIKIWSSDHVQTTAADRTSVRKKELFCRVSQDMRNVGFDRDWHQCRNKIKDLKQEYRMALRCTSDKRRNTCKFFDELDGVLKKRHTLKRDRMSLNGYRQHSLIDGEREYNSEGHETYFPSCSSLLESVDNHDFLGVSREDHVDEPVEAFNESAFSHIEASFQTPKHQHNGSVDRSPLPRTKGDKAGVSAKKRRTLVLRPSRELECVLETLVGRFLEFQRDSEERFLKAQRHSQEGFLNYLRESEERFGRLSQLSDEKWSRWQEKWIHQERDREDARRKDDREQHMRMMQMLGDMFIQNSHGKSRVNLTDSVSQSPDLTLTKPVSPPPLNTDLLHPTVAPPEPMPRLSKETINPVYHSSSDDYDSLTHPFYDQHPQSRMCRSPGQQNLYVRNSAEEEEAEAQFRHMNGNQEKQQVLKKKNEQVEGARSSGSDDASEVQHINCRSPTGKKHQDREDYDRKERESGFTSDSEDLGHASSSPTSNRSTEYMQKYRRSTVATSKEYLHKSYNNGSSKDLRLQSCPSSASSDSVGPIRLSPVHSAFPIKGAGPTTL